MYSPIIFTANPKPNAMINLKKFFQPNPFLLAVSKREKELLESFFPRKSEYENWQLQHPQQKIRFRFYFPTAMVFFYDSSILFTAYFKKGADDIPVLHELKMSKANHTSIRSVNWKPFEEVMTTFLLALEERKQVVLVQKTRSLREYVDICNEASPAA
jgi:hypothetical protein